MFVENEEMILPDDFVEDTTPTEPTEEINNEVETEETLEGTPTNENEPPTPQEQKIKIKYNHEDRELTLEEATQLAQKGMNYDKIQQQYNEMQNNPGLQYLNDLAQRNDMSVEDLVSYWKQQEEQDQLQELIQSNIPEEYAQEILENRKFRQEQQQERQTKQQEEQQQAELMEFINTFPDVDPSKIPPEIWQKVNEGVPIKYAYMEHQMSELKNQVKVLKNNETNKKKAPLGSVSATGGNDEGEDPFLMGFNF
jgi:hypothetical protein